MTSTDFDKSNDTTHFISCKKLDEDKLLKSLIGNVKKKNFVYIESVQADDLYTLVEKLDKIGSTKGKIKFEIGKCYYRSSDTDVLKELTENENINIHSTHTYPTNFS